ncbi:NAD-dependent epimerase/dehydratase family protein [Georgenia sp. H159]|uniref:polysaccharide biosynthesis C-terminal domain-containing protein n=1 Tax=Georgenia sp. H159 TaxID=3076115 RepID=UPI002D76744B|nr:NAD-dependent epimerase/dehydratase family protein [Georgenia sp. H159]
MRIVVTGADGFLGWHTRARLRARTPHAVVPVGRAGWSDLPGLVRDADVILHLAGVNRGTDREVLDGNVRLAEDVAAAVRGSQHRPAIVFANSVRAGESTSYGAGKHGAAAILAQAASDTGSRFADVALPNLFGEHGKPAYNSFVATFVASVIRGETPDIADREIELLHAQDAAQSIINAAMGTTETVRPRGTLTTVGDVLGTLHAQHTRYRTGDIPPLGNPLETDLFNTLRAAMASDNLPIPLVRRADARGALVETVRAHGSEGQSFFSTTRPGVTRGQHLHLRKIERFVVVSGKARISLRRVLTDKVLHVDVTGEEPVAVDMPTLWAHSITNTGDGELTTIFWANELFDPDDPDTYPEDV